MLKENYNFILIVAYGILYRLIEKRVNCIELLLCHFYGLYEGQYAAKHKSIYIYNKLSHSLLIRFMKVQRLVGEYILTIILP